MRYVHAIAVCVALSFVCAIISGILGWRHRGELDELSPMSQLVPLIRRILMPFTSFVRAIEMLLIALISVMAPCHAAGYFYDGNHLVSDMREWENAQRSFPNTDYISSAAHMGYVLGVADSFSATICDQGRVTVGQVENVVARYLNDHPAEWSAPAYQLVAKALQEAFPCR